MPLLCDDRGYWQRRDAQQPFTSQLPSKSLAETHVTERGIEKASSSRHTASMTAWQSKQHETLLAQHRRRQMEGSGRHLESQRGPVLHISLHNTAAVREASLRVPLFHAVDGRLVMLEERQAIHLCPGMILAVTLNPVSWLLNAFCDSKGLCRPLHKSSCPEVSISARDR